VNTTTYQANTDYDIFNTYFCSWKKNPTNKDSVLILWNEVPNDNGKIYGMKPSEKPGTTTMLYTDFGSTEAIPGLPSYFG